LEKRDEEGAMVASPVFVQMLIREGVHLHSLRDSMLTLSRLYDRSCYGVQHSTTTFDEVWALAQPLFAIGKRGSSRAPTVLELVPLIQHIRKMPHVMMSNQKHSGHFAKYSDAFVKWLSLNPAIQRYLDPPSVLIQPSNVPALPNIAAIIAALPDRFPGKSLHLLCNVQL
jgi:hypothetical protein